MEQPEIYFTNTLTRKKERFVPIEAGKVRLYTCGPTVYDFAHIGNFRTYVFEDILRRTLEFFGFDVHHVMNLTDVDDKTIRGAVRNQSSLEEYTKPFIAAFFEDLDTLHIQRAHDYPAATAYISEMIALIESLQKKGLAYQGGDKSLYYAIDKFPSYGALAHLKKQQLQSGASGRLVHDEYEKENIGDFVLWKHYDPERDGSVFWESPFGPGRPGWHLECSTMAMALLGKTLDIHCGGVDNIFPHHENEIAQSEAVTGVPFAHYWLHSEHLVVDNKKMSKSLGNFYRLRDLLEKGYTGKQVRYLLLQTHYKTPLNFTFAGLQAAKEAIQRMDECVYRLETAQHVSEVAGLHDRIGEAYRDFSRHLADDLNTSAALAAVFAFVRDVNAALDRSALSQNDIDQALDFFRKIDAVLGVVSFQQEESIPAAMQALLENRNAARKAKNWAEADALRDAIAEAGYLIEDTSSGSHLRRRL